MSLCKRLLTSSPSLFFVIMAMTFLLGAQRSVYSSTALPAISAAQISIIKNFAIPLNNINDNESVIKLINNKPLVLIGDSTHGTYEFYQQRINISQQLIVQKNFKSILLEGNWPDVSLMNQYVLSLTPMTAEQALHTNKTQAVNLWQNRAMLKFIKWLKNYNQQLPENEQKVTLHGLDIYSFKRSKQLVIDYLQGYLPFALQQTIQRYQCFTQFNDNLHHYGKAVKENISLSCEYPVVQQYLDFSACRIPCPAKTALIDSDAFFAAQQNARIVKNSEKNFRILYQTANDTLSWNERDKHMMETFLAVSAHLNYPKLIIWAHNSHLGDARATEMAQKNQLNIGQLLREKFGEAVFSIGMLTYSGSVMAADEWGKPARLKVLLDAHNESNEALFHSLNMPHFLLSLQRTATSQQSQQLAQILNRARLQRHVGVVYMPQDEMSAHYTYTHLAEQFDAIIFIDSSSAVIPLEY